ASQYAARRTSVVTPFQTVSPAPLPGRVRLLQYSGGSLRSPPAKLLSPQLGRKHATVFMKSVVNPRDKPGAGLEVLADAIETAVAQHHVPFVPRPGIGVPPVSRSAVGSCPREHPPPHRCLLLLRGPRSDDLRPLVERIDRRSDRRAENAEAERAFRFFPYRLMAGKSNGETLHHEGIGTVRVEDLRSAGVVRYELRDAGQQQPKLFRLGGDRREKNLLQHARES